MSTSPSQRTRTLGLQPSFGFGDRLGTATPGHISSLRAAGGSIKGIFAQQSIREMTRTKRSPDDVMNAAAKAVEAAGFDDAWGADADHIKTPDDARATAAAGFVFFTIDPSEHVDRQADDYDLPTLEAKLTAVREQVDWLETYLNRTVKVPDGATIEFDRPTVLRAAVKYGRAIAHAVTMGKAIAEAAGAKQQLFEIEISVDETDQPTSLAEHYIIAEQMRRHELPVVSLAPRFIGDFEKGVDYKGSVATFAKSVAEHAAIARHLGPYKLSLHSGSDKLSIYPDFAKATRGLFHVKTAGTSYMEALRVVARCAPAELRELCNFSREFYDRDKATYHVSATLENVPAPADVSPDEKLVNIYLDAWPITPAGRGFTSIGRQILHCTFGSVLTDAKFGPLVRQVVAENQAVYDEVLHDHFTRHLRALAAGM
jgi:hypothetical protein